jgi:hypothetical protein
VVDPVVQFVVGVAVEASDALVDDPGRITRAGRTRGTLLMLCRPLEKRNRFAFGVVSLCATIVPYWSYL